MTTVSADESARHGRLLGLKLRALATAHLGREVESDPVQFAPGAALLAGEQAWVLLDDRAGSPPARRLGAALAWALRAGASSVHVVSEVDAGPLARRAAEFTIPISVWSVPAGGRDLLGVDIEPLPPPPEPARAHLAMRELIAAGGATPLVEHDVVFGEVRGLEVCRVIDDPGSGVRLEVGVGAHDREAFQMVHGDVPTVESLSRVVDAVSAHRRPDADQHPLNRIARERFLRWQLEQEPSRVGATSLAPVAPPVPRPNVKDPVPCLAEGADSDGRPVTVVCSAGVDLDLVPFVADVRIAAAATDTHTTGTAPPRRLVIAVPARDRLAILDDLLALLAPSPRWSAAEIVTLGHG